MDPADPDELVREYSLDTIDEAEASVGLYAWYAILPAGLQDWELGIDESGRDLGADRLREVLRRQTARHFAQSMRANVTGTFSQCWSGELRDHTMELLERALQSHGERSVVDDYDAVGATRVQDSLDSRDARQLLVQVLRHAAPFIAAPLYVGVAESLRTRLRRHVDQLRKYYRIASEDASARTRFRIDGKNFAMRAVGAGFVPDQLRVWTLCVDGLIRSLDATPQDPRGVTEAAEWLLNRWYRPYLGRR